MVVPPSLPFTFYNGIHWITLFEHMKWDPMQIQQYPREKKITLGVERSLKHSIFHMWCIRSQCNGCTEIVNEWTTNILACSKAHISSAEWDTTNLIRHFMRFISFQFNDMAHMTWTKQKISNCSQFVILRHEWSRNEKKIQLSDDLFTYCYWNFEQYGFFLLDIWYAYVRVGVSNIMWVDRLSRNPCFQ